MNIGDKVRVMGIPDGVPPDNKQLLTLFGGCVGKTFPIVKIDDGLVELHVGEAFGKPAEYPSDLARAEPSRSRRGLTFEPDATNRSGRRGRCRPRSRGGARSRSSRIPTPARRR